MKKTNFIFIAILCIIYAMSTNAQENNRTWGISASIQETQLDILFPIWTGANNIIAPSIGAIHIGDSGTDLRLGLLDRIFFNATESIKPFLGLRAGVLFSIPDEQDTVTDYVIGILGGGEYFFSNNFSVGVEAQLNMSISDENSSRFGNPGGTNINTATAIFATIYF
jgi:hypothetical protein